MIKMIAREEKKIKKFKGSIDRKLILSERRYDKMAGIVQRNIERNEGERAFMSEDTDMINILATYRV